MSHSTHNTLGVTIVGRHVKEPHFSCILCGSGKLPRGSQVSAWTLYCLTVGGVSLLAHFPATGSQASNLALDSECGFSTGSGVRSPIWA
eukprot:m.511612 g.511612  ORF g.511612 m.511612 type:complete len:89 (+) comp57429_c0_seq1:4069-4335(+)